MISETIKYYVRRECIKPGNVFGSSFFDQHLQVVACYGRNLANILSADTEVVEISAYLHDISAIQDIKTLANHRIISAEIAGEILLEKKYPNEKIEIVKSAIISHVTPVPIGDGSLEAVCISNADAMAQIVKPSYWLYYAYAIRKLNFSDGREWFLQRLENNWNALIEPAKYFIEREYNQVKKTLQLENISLKFLETNRKPLMPHGITA